MIRTIMILTDSFVYIHQSKTGGTFVTKVLTRIHEARSGDDLWARCRRCWLGMPGFVDTRKNGMKHATCSEIPASHQGKPILATARNPYDRLVSQYEFGWWARHPSKNGLERQLFPHFPKLTFEEFVELGHRLLLARNPNSPAAESLGQQTGQFVRYFFKNPHELFPKIDESYLATQAYKKHMYPVHFLNTEHLNEELYNYLLQVGYNPSEIALLRSAEKVFPREGDMRKGKLWQEYYSPELKALVRKRERLLFAVFPEFDV